MTPQTPTNETDPEDDQYQVACGDNIAFVMDMLEAMRFEAELIGDGDSARLWAGLINVIAAFRLRNSPRPGLRQVLR